MIWPTIVHADTLRIATYHTELSRKYPGLLLRDITRGNDPQVAGIVRTIAQTKPDILLLQGLDFDHDLLTLTALRDAIAESGPFYAHMFALRPNTGLQTGLDLDGDGRTGEPEDAHSYGWYAGEGGMALLSRYPVDSSAVLDFSSMLWADLPTPLWPEHPMPGQNKQRLSRVSHWVVPVVVSSQRLTLLAFHATPPVFDGPEDRNGRRNHDELALWQHYLNGTFGSTPNQPFVVMGNANIDPNQGEGRKAAFNGLLNDPRLQDPRPRRQPPSGTHPLATVHWPTPGPGERRVSYILPSFDLTVLDAAVYWPLSGGPASRHRLVWVDLMLP